MIRRNLVTLEFMILRLVMVVILIILRMKLKIIHNPRSMVLNLWVTTLTKTLDLVFRDYIIRQCLSVHHFHSYAVADRVNFSGYSEAVHKNVTINPLSLIPSLEAIKKEFQVLISRYVQYIVYCMEVDLFLFFKEL